MGVFALFVIARGHRLSIKLVLGAVKYEDAVNKSSLLHSEEIPNIQFVLAPTPVITWHHSQQTPNTKIIWLLLL
jgi:hypothetical protein